MRLQCCTIQNVKGGGCSNVAVLLVYINSNILLQHTKTVTNLMETSNNQHGEVGYKVNRYVLRQLCIVLQEKLGPI